MKLNLIQGLDFWVEFWAVGSSTPTKSLSDDHLRGNFEHITQTPCQTQKTLGFSNTKHFRVLKLLSMTSSSSSAASMSKTCFYCRTVCTILRPGWRLRNGNSALLCIRCASAYEEGRFCNIFHPDASGWRDCVTCKKIVHCGCIMSTHTHIELDFGGVRCIECIANDTRMGANSCTFQFKNARPRTLQDLPEIKLYVDLGKVTTGITTGTPSQKDASSYEIREQLYINSPDGVDISDSTTINNKKPQSGGPKKIHSYRQYLPKVSNEELQQIQKDSKSDVVPLFEKELTISDVDSKNSRLVIPKKCAQLTMEQDYLPKISEPQGIPITIQDTNGKYWNFRYRYWPNNNSTMYILEGTKDYMAENQCRPGDKVTFYRIDPEGQLVMGLKKAQASTSIQEVFRLMEWKPGS